MKSPTQGVVCRGCFQIQPPICGVNFKQSIHTQGQDQPEENWIWLGNLLTLNLKDK